MRALLDTSVVIASSVRALPDEAAISAATLAELHFGVHFANNPETRRNRIHRLAEIEANLDPLPIDARVARTYGALADAVARSGRKPRRRVMDLLIAATAQTHQLPLYTRDADDFAGLSDELEIILV